MTRSSVRTRLVQMEVRPGWPSENTEVMLEHIRAAQQEGAELVVFPELAVPGYLLGDEWERDAFIRECEACGDDLRVASQGVTVVFGNVGVDRRRRNEDGRIRKYNALFVARDGRFLAPADGLYDFVIKTLLPNYREFDDSRHFFDLRKLAIEEGRSVDSLIRPVEADGLRLGCVLCEDAWDMDYAVSPLSILAQQGVDLFINSSASPYTANKTHKRHRVFSAHARQLKRPLVYVNNTGIQNNGKTVFTFDGASCIYDGADHIVPSGPSFGESGLTFDIPLTGAPFGQPIQLVDDGMPEIYRAIDYGTRRFLKLCGARTVVVGVSGGIDSAVVAALYSRIVEPDELLLVNMPSRHNSPTTRGLARALADNLGCGYVDVPIEESVALTTRQLDGLVIAGAEGRNSRTLSLGSAVLENVQARDRSSRVLAAIAASVGGVFTCNANKSEATVGYTTLYGDLGGYLANIADLWKTEVTGLARHLNQEVFREETIPQGSIDIVPSAELSAEQDVDRGLGDPLHYPYHDALFASWVEWWNRVTPEEIVQWYAEGCLEKRLGYAGRVRDLFATHAAFVDDLERWWNLYQGMALAKRIQAPPILAVKRRAFGFDHRESQMGPRYTRAYGRLKDTLLEGGECPPTNAHTDSP